MGHLVEHHCWDSAGRGASLLKTAKSAEESAPVSRRGCSSETSIGDMQQLSGFGEKKMVNQSVLS